MKSAIALFMNELGKFSGVRRQTDPAIAGEMNEARFSTVHENTGENSKESASAAIGSDSDTESALASEKGHYSEPIEFEAEEP